jgi:hypothetical protein
MMLMSMLSRFRILLPRLLLQPTTIQPLVLRLRPAIAIMKQVTTLELMYRRLPAKSRVEWRCHVSMR